MASIMRTCTPVKITRLLSTADRRACVLRFNSSSASAGSGLYASKRPNSAEARLTESLVFETKRYEERHEEVVRNRATPEALLNATLLEEELRAEMAAALGRMDTRLRERMRVMDEASSKVHQVLARPTRDVGALLEAVQDFNKAQEAAYDARLDLIVQRQSAGFWLDNHALIMKRYPIPPKKKVRM